MMVSSVKLIDIGCDPILHAMVCILSRVWIAGLPPEHCDAEPKHGIQDVTEGDAIVSYPIHLASRRYSAVIVSI